MIFHESSIGKQVILRGRPGGMIDTICSISGNKELFRVQSEENGPVVHDYSISDIVDVSSIIVSVVKDEWSAWSIHGAATVASVSNLRPPVTSMMTSAIISDSIPPDTEDTEKKTTTSPE